MKKGTGDMPKIRQNTKNQPYMTNQCLWKPELKPEKMDYGKRLSIPRVRALFGKKWKKIFFSNRQTDRHLGDLGQLQLRTELNKLYHC